ncbi:hypothetical protein tb265_33420 [Gemmatimonadetes bacterium T265]|nr:hypothetical protein tb265_33420 [Gemmatimonadetes bacterium T265]
MFRNVFALGLCAIIGVVALKFAFGIAGGLLGAAFGLFFWLLGLAVRLLVVAFVAYLVLLVVSPQTARRVRSRVSDMF